MSRSPRSPLARAALPALLLAGLLAGAAHGAESALVEEVAAPSAGLRFMDYLSPGQVVTLRPGESIVLDYLHSCSRESIAGGTITIGTDRSTVTGGTVHRETVECDGGKMELTAAQAATSGVMVFRDLRAVAAAPAPRRVTLYGESPIIDLPAGGVVTIDRTDRPGERHRIAIKPLDGRAVPYDCAQHGLRLAPGGSYRATAGKQEILFRVAADARRGMSPLVGRLLRF